MPAKKMFMIGTLGTLVTALCCFTPFLVVILGLLGLSGWLLWIDYVLFPLLLGFVVLMLAGSWRLWGRGERRAEAQSTPEDKDAR